jgi:hypothetical protein
MIIAFNPPMILTAPRPNDLAATTGGYVVPYNLCNLSTTPIIRLFLKYWSEKYGSSEKVEPISQRTDEVRRGLGLVRRRVGNHTNILPILGGDFQSLDQRLNIPNTLVEALSRQWVDGMSGIPSRPQRQTTGTTCLQTKETTRRAGNAHPIKATLSDM